MKKNSLIIGFILIPLFSTTLFGQFNQPDMKYYPIETEIRNAYARYDTIPAPEWEFIKYPTELMTSYYDYMPGGYNGYPLRLRTVDGNDIVLTFQASPVPTSNREIYMTYIYEDGTIDGPWLYAHDGHPGFPTIVIHSSSGNIIYAYHSTDGIVLYYEDFLPGFWPPPLVVEGEYLCPNLYIGPSPIEDKVRMYLLSSSEDVRVMYIDIDEDENVNMDELLNINNWSEIFVFTDWSNYEIRPYPSFAVSWDEPGKVAFIGYAGYLEEPPNPPVEEGFFVYESLDWGETWSLYDFGMPPAIENLLQFEDHQGNVLDSIDVIILGFNHNTAIFDGQGNLHWCYTGGYGYTGNNGNLYYFLRFIPACEMVRFGDDNVEWRNIWPQVPWEINENGDTLVHYSHAVSGYDEGANIFLENTQKQAVNLENNWMIQVWADGTYNMLAQEGDTTYQDYFEHPIIFVSASKDNGVHWTEPIPLTDISSEVFLGFADQITVYPYICDQIVDLGDGWGQVYMYYFDDNSFGSSVYGQGLSNGGKITYCSFKINFDEIVAVDEEQEMPSPEILLYNYPNPFSGSTTISFFNIKTTPVLRSSATAKGEKDTEIRIYNIKGQLVKTLECPDIIGINAKTTRSLYSISWDGKDENDRELPNGIYLYQLNCGNQSITKKLILLR